MSGIASTLRDAVLRANLELVESGLVMGTFGNASAVDRAARAFVIKPSGVPYERLDPADMVPVSLETGEVLEGELRPSSDAPTHLELYRAFPCGGIVHTHSEYATAFAQAGRPIACTGTTHADYFHGDVPVTRSLTPEEVDGEYERNTGLVIVERFRELDMSPQEMPGVLVANHGPFTWGADVFLAVEHARVLEYVARVEMMRIALDPDAPSPARFLIDRHYRRKHGADAYYGQPSNQRTP